MNREVKFRLWDDTRDVMLSHEQLVMAMDWEDRSVLDYVLDKDGSYGGTEGRNASWSYAKDEFEEENIVILPSEEHLHLMQFTGETGWRGVPIYEGDIIENFKHPEGTRKVVAWGELRLSETGQFIYMGWNIVLPSSDSKVIGNIWQNPELQP